VYASQRPFGDQSAQIVLTPGGGLVKRERPLPPGPTVNKTACPPTVRPKRIRPFSPLKVADASGVTIRRVSATNRAAIEAERAFMHFPRRAVSRPRRQ
jgi:hypothetical protein